MKFKRIVTGVVAGAALLAAGMANAADWKPDGPLKLQIGFGAGGSTDTMGRVLAKVMEDQTGWNIVAENKTGGGGVAMFTGIAKMPPRGKVIGLGVNMPDPRQSGEPRRSAGIRSRQLRLSRHHLEGRAGPGRQQGRAVR